MRKYFALLAILAGAACGSSSTPQGEVSLTWMFTQDGVRVDCTAVDADVVQVISTGSAGPFTDTFDCENEAGTSFPIDQGTYTVTVDLLQCPNTQSGCPGGTSLNDLTPVTNVHVSGGQTTNIGNFIFAF